MPLTIVQGDITRIRADAIVNAANPQLTAGGGVCGAIFAGAGREKMRLACDKIGSCPVGGAVLTPGFLLPARWVIHTVGPVWQGGTHGEEALLRACYQNALALASARHMRSVAFPLISAGIYGYPRDAVLAVAVSEIGAYLLHHDIVVTIALFEGGGELPGAARFRGIRAMLGAKTEATNPAVFSARKQSSGSFGGQEPPMFVPLAMPAPSAVTKPQTIQTKLEEAAGRIGETFSQRLLRLIDERGFTDPEVYRRANLDRRLFSKIRANKQYQPSKSTALAFAVALRLNLDQTADLLRAAGYALSPGSRFDRIVEYFIQNGTYDIFEINEALFAFGENLLGA